MKIDSARLQALQTEMGQHSQRAFEELYRLFFTRLYRFSMLSVHTREAAEEVVNDVMVKLWLRREQLHTVADLETYLFVAVRNGGLNYLQKYSHLHIALDECGQQAQLVQAGNPQNDLEWKELSHTLNMAIASMPSSQRTIFKLVKEEGLRYRQVAEILGISPRTVETQLVRANKKLLAVLATTGPAQKRRKSSAFPFGPLILVASLVTFFEAL